MTINTISKLPSRELVSNCFLTQKNNFTMTPWKSGLFERPRRKRSLFCMKLTKTIMIKHIVRWM